MAWKSLQTSCSSLLIQTTSACFSDRLLRLWHYLPQFLQVLEGKRPKMSTSFVWVMVYNFLTVPQKKSFNNKNTCFLIGNADGLGKMRKEELTKSCRILGISDANVVLHRYFLFIVMLLELWYMESTSFKNYFDFFCSGPPHFEDNQKLAWDAKLVADTLITYIQKFKINCVMINPLLLL